MNSIFKKWWFWVIVVLVIVAIGSAKDSSNNTATDSPAGTTGVVETISYEVVDLQQMLDELDANALKAERAYQDKYIQITGKITNFDSDGKYISVEPVYADEWDLFNTVMCYIKNDEQLELLLTKAIGDTITIKGRVKSIGEVLGYTLYIDEIN